MVEWKQPYETLQLAVLELRDVVDELDKTLVRWMKDMEQKLEEIKKEVKELVDLHDRVLPEEDKGKRGARR